MEFIKYLIDFVLHIDVHMVEIVNNYQGWTYLILFFIIFAETGLVVTPFLPGDSLLFAAGTIVAKPDATLSIYLLWVLLMVAAVVGNLVNYRVGIFVGPRAFSDRYKLIKIEYLTKAQQFYSKYGGKTIIYARFIPILRTFAPFVAGMANMTYSKFASYNIFGGIGWVVLVTLIGYYIGNVDIVRRNFEKVLLGIVLVSVLPIVFEYLRGRKRAN